MKKLNSKTYGQNMTDTELNGTVFGINFDIVGTLGTVVAVMTHFEIIVNMFLGFIKVKKNKIPSGFYPDLSKNEYYGYIQYWYEPGKLLAGYQNPITKDFIVQIKEVNDPNKAKRQLKQLLKEFGLENFKNV